MNRQPQPDVVFLVFALHSVHWIILYHIGVHIVSAATVINVKALVELVVAAVSAAEAVE